MQYIGAGSQHVVVLTTTSDLPVFEADLSLTFAVSVVKPDVKTEVKAGEKIEEKAIIKEMLEETKEVGKNAEPEAKSAASKRSYNSKASVAKSLKSVAIKSVKSGRSQNSKASAKKRTLS